jgi:hypothetical protein
MKNLKEELAEIDKKINMLSKKKKGSSGLVFIVCCMFLILVIGSVFAQTEADSALSEIGNAGLAIQDMLEAGFGTSYANDTLNEAQVMLSRGEYAAASALANQVWEIRDAAFGADQLINQAEETIYLTPNDIDVSDARVMIDEGITLFESENYLESKDRLEGAIELLEDLMHQAALEKSSGGVSIAFLVDQWYVVLTVLVMGSLIVLMIQRQAGRARKKRSRKELEKEINSIETMIKKVQENYFSKDGVGVNDYNVAMDKYRKRLAILKKNLYLIRKVGSGGS